MFLNPAGGNKEFAFLTAKELKITPPRVRKTYPVDAGIMLKV